VALNFIKEKPNFFDDPIAVRDYALRQKFLPYVFNSNTIWSGARCLINNSTIEKELREKLEILNKKKIQVLSSSFHLNPSVSMHGFPHKDSSNLNSFAGVVYLNKDYPENCGTTIYEDLPNDKPFCDQYITNFFDKMEIVYNTTLNPRNNFKLKYSEECLKFKNDVLKKIKSIDFEFNKLVCYPGYVLHSPDLYFGDTITNSRLTIAFHGEFNAN
jgi:hypothetical protein